MMKIDRFFLCLLAAAAVFSGCNKDDDTVPEQKYLYGVLKFDKNIPEFIEHGYKQDLVISGAYHPEASRKSDGKYTDTLGYFVENAFATKNDTLKTFGDPVDQKIVYHFEATPDTLASFTLVAYAYAPGYYSSSCSSAFTIVKPGFSGKESLRGFNTEGNTEKIGSKVYFVTDVDDVTWMRQNLSEPGSGQSFHGCEIMDDIFGRFYTWEEAQTVCPSGWQLPSSDDLDALLAKYGSVKSLMADIYFNGNKSEHKLWTFWPAVGALTDESGLSLMPAGYAAVTGDDFEFFDFRKRAVLWTSSSDTNSGNGIARYIYEDQDLLFSGRFSKTDFAAPVRCIRKN